MLFVFTMYALVNLPSDTYVDVENECNCVSLAVMGMCTKFFLGSNTVYIL